MCRKRSVPTWWDEMPLYEYQCSQGHVFLRVTAVRDHAPLAVCDCGNMGTQIIGAPVMVTAQPECRYDSPIDGTPITTWAQRDYDLKKHNCRPYDPGMKTDHVRQLQDKEQALERSIDQHVEASISKMSTKERGKLFNELTRAGTDLTVNRK